MFKSVESSLQSELQGIRDAGIYKEERIITSTQGAVIDTTVQQAVLNFCANNYLGLSSHPEVTEAAIEAIRSHGYGMSSVRFICGTQNIHKELERRLSEFLGMEDTILYAAAFDANGGLFEPLLGAEDAIISDELNHASIIDGIRLCKAQRWRYKHNDMNALEDCLKEAVAAGTRRKLIFTDGAFSMDGTIAQLDKICDLAERYDAMVGIDECHASGFLGKTGRGTHEYRGVMDRVDIVTGTLGKALGGASGGFTAARKEIVDMLRQRSRPYLFSNTVAPSIVGASIKVMELLSSSTALRDKLERNTQWFRSAMTAAGFDIIPGEHPIVPIIGFFYPVVAQGKARIRVQISAAHEQEHLEKAVAGFTKIGKELGVI
jgi:glycine C-acetyltransferase